MDETASLPGGSAINHARVLRIALPMSLAYLSTPLLGLVDTAVIGRLGSAPLLGGVAVGAALFGFVFTTFNFLRMGTTALTAQAQGAGAPAEMRAVLFRTMLIAFAVGLMLIALADPIVLAGLALMGASDEVTRAARAYCDIRMLAAPLTLANYAILGWVLGLGRAGLGLALQTILNGTNIALSIWFVLGLGWGIEGVAYSTLAAEALAALAGIGAIAILYGRSARVPLRLILDRARFARLFSVNGDIMVRSMALLFVFTFFTAESARQTDLVLAANAVLLNFFLVASYILDGFAVAAEQLVGGAIGARSRANARRAISLTLGWGLALGLVMSVIVIAAGPFVIDLLTTSPAIRDAAREFLPWAAVTPAAGALAFLYDGIYVGATWSRAMRNWMLASVAIAAIVWWIALPLYGNHGLWLALVAFLAARGLTLGLRCPANLERTFASQPEIP